MNEDLDSKNNNKHTQDSSDNLNSIISSIQQDLML